MTVIITYHKIQNRLDYCIFSHDTPNHQSLHFKIHAPSDIPLRRLIFQLILTQLFFLTEKRALREVSVKN